jgi:hypothetical protein
MTTTLTFRAGRDATLRGTALLCDWIWAQHLDPSDVHSFMVADGTITVTTYRRNAHGARYVVGDEAAKETRTVPLVTPLPDDLAAALTEE